MAEAANVGIVTVTGIELDVLIFIWQIVNLTAPSIAPVIEVPVQVPGPYIGTATFGRLKDPDPDPSAATPDGPATIRLIYISALRYAPPVIITLAILPDGTVYNNEDTLSKVVVELIIEEDVPIPVFDPLR